METQASLLFLILLFFFSFCYAEDSAKTDEIISALDSAKKAYSEKNYRELWQKVAVITYRLQQNAPRQGLPWPRAEILMRDWVKKKWHEDVIEIQQLSQGGMEETVERHFGRFWGWTWETGEKTVTKDFVFQARVITKKPAGKKGDYKIRFHFDKTDSGWHIKSGV